MLQDGSVTAASERLHLSIPATSRAPGRLRRAMGDPILVRAGRGMAPTPFALRTAPRVRSLLDEASALISADREITVAELKRTFTIRINDGVAATMAAAAAGGQCGGEIMSGARGEIDVTPIGFRIGVVADQQSDVAAVGVGR